jgi:hypothetical protein
MYFVSLRGIIHKRNQCSGLKPRPHLVDKKTEVKTIRFFNP